jgi:hypothetical protein
VEVAVLVFLPVLKVRAVQVVEEPQGLLDLLAL